MGNQKEKVEEKVAPVSKENLKEETPKDKSKSKEKPKSESKSEVTVSEIEKLQNDIKAQGKFTSDLQKKLNESNSIIEVLKTAFTGEENAETDAVTAETVKTQLDSLTSELAKEKAENAKNTYIDSLDIQEHIKKDLKRRIHTTDDIEEVVKSELDSIEELLQNITPQATDTRPKGLGTTQGNSDDANYVLDHPEQFK